MKRALKEEAIKLRLQGQSIGQIEKSLDVARSTVSRWVSQTKLDPEIIEKIFLTGRNSTIIKSKIVREQFRLSMLEEGRRDCEKDQDFRTICALYWGEGSKVQRDVSISNCDVRLLKVFANWFIKLNRHFTLSVAMYDNADIEIVTAWWASALPGIKQEDIRVWVKEGGKNNKQPYGTGVIRACKSIDLYWKLMGGIDFLAT